MIEDLCSQVIGMMVGSTLSEHVGNQNVSRQSIRKALRKAGKEYSGEALREAIKDAKNKNAFLKGAVEKISSTVVDILIDEVEISSPEKENNNPISDVPDSEENNNTISETVDNEENNIDTYDYIETEQHVISYEKLESIKMQSKVNGSVNIDNYDGISAIGAIYTVYYMVEGEITEYHDDTGIPNEWLSYAIWWEEGK